MALCVQHVRFDPLYVFPCLIQVNLSIFLAISIVSVQSKEQDGAGMY